MAALSDTLTFARTQLKTDSDGLTDADGIEFANEAKLDFARRLIARGVDAAQLQESYTDGVVDQYSYLYPTDMFFLKAIELNYTNTSADDYITATQVDVSNLPQGKSFSWIRGNTSINNPKFDDRGDHFEIYPTPTSAHNVSQLIRIFYFLEPTEFTATTDAISYPESLDHRILGWRIAGNYLKSIEKYDQASDLLTEYEKRVEELINTLSRGSQQPIQSTPLNITGWQF